MIRYSVFCKKMNRFRTYLPFPSGNLMKTIDSKTCVVRDIYHDIHFHTPPDHTIDDAIKLTRPGFRKHKYSYR